MQQVKKKMSDCRGCIKRISGYDPGCLVCIDNSGKKCLSCIELLVAIEELKKDLNDVIKRDEYLDKGTLL